MTPMTEEEIVRAVGQLPGWSRDGAAIQRQFTFAGFPDAVAFVVRLGFAAEAADHHPDILINYKRVTLRYTTHSAGGLTPRDFEGARQADAIAASPVRST